MSDSEDDYEYHYSDSDVDDPMDTTEGNRNSGSKTSASLLPSAADIEFATEKVS